LPGGPGLQRVETLGENMGFLHRNTACSSEALCINPAIQNTILASWFAFDCLGLDAISHFQDGNIWKDGGNALGDGPGKFANVKM